MGGAADPHYVTWHPNQDPRGNLKTAGGIVVPYTRPVVLCGRPLSGRCCLGCCCCCCCLHRTLPAKARWHLLCERVQLWVAYLLHLLHLLRPLQQQLQQHWGRLRLKKAAAAIPQGLIRTICTCGLVSGGCKTSAALPHFLQTQRRSAISAVETLARSVLLSLPARHGRGCRLLHLLPAVQIPQACRL